MKILLFAPRHPDLLYADDEVQSILRSGNDVVPVIGTVTHPEFLAEILATDAQCLWLCTHGTAEGFYLSSGILPTPLLVSAARGRFRLIVLNTCNSIAAAQMLQRDTDADIIATITDVPDIEAFQTGALFAHSLAKTDDPAMAKHDAEPGGNRNYVYLASKKKVL